jgi:uncharacterized protein YggE
MRLGAVAQAETAGAAQSQVNTIMSRALHSIRALGIDEKAIRTSGLFVQPVFSQPPRGGGAGYEPTIVGYRAGNTVVVRLDDLELLGRVIDAGVAAGANQISGPSFSLADDTPQRREALARAVRQARVKAEAIAAAMGERIVAVRSVVEGGSSPGRPPMEYARAAAVGTPVEPGQVLVQASVTITYVIAPTQR